MKKLLLVATLVGAVLGVGCAGSTTAKPITPAVTKTKPCAAEAKADPAAAFLGLDTCPVKRPASHPASQPR